MRGSRLAVGVAILSSVWFLVSILFAVGVSSTARSHSDYIVSLPTATSIALQIRDTCNSTLVDLGLYAACALVAMRLARHSARPHQSTAVWIVATLCMVVLVNVGAHVFLYFGECDLETTETAWLLTSGSTHLAREGFALSAESLLYYLVRYLPVVTLAALLVGCGRSRTTNMMPASG